SALSLDKACRYRPLAAVMALAARPASAVFLHHRDSRCLECVASNADCITALLPARGALCRVLTRSLRSSSGCGLRARPFRSSFPDPARQGDELTATVA